MPLQPPIPPLLSPDLSGPPSGSLTLLTSTLGASTNWLVLRFVYATLKSLENDRERGQRSNAGEARVVLVSWLRDANFWREGGRKLGINFQKVHIIDALSSGLGLGAAGLADVEAEIGRAGTAATEATKGEGRVLLVLDGLDFLLAAKGCPALQILDLVGSLREHVHSTLLTTCADLSFTQSPTTPLETSQAAFVMSLAHQARMLLSVRGLDTGVARDVSGVMRVSRGGGYGGGEDDGGGEVEERECLYFVGGDGGVKVFERGA